MISYPPAKINIGLWVKNRRPDAYHSIESIFYPVGLQDILEIIPSPDGQFLFFSSGLDISCDISDNLVVKAFRLLQGKYDLPEVHIHLHKIIPTGSGLGGGSSDAASCLLLLNSIFDLHIESGALREMASLIGSDIPFFIDALPSLVTGKGELVEALDFSLASYTLTIVLPAVHISTKEAYAGIHPIPRSTSLKEIVYLPIEQWKDLVINDFELSVFAMYPELAQIKDQLYDAGALYAAMTGSGSALFGISREELRLPYLQQPYQSTVVINL